MILTLSLLFVASVWAGMQNALAGGGTFVVFPAFLFAGLDARGANIAAAIALLPGQLCSGCIGRRFISGLGGLPFSAFLGASLAGGIVGALLLLVTPSAFFAHLVPWLVAFATAVFAYGSFGRHTALTRAHMARPWPAMLMQIMIAIYGGYFGGGIGFMMLAALSLSGMAMRSAAANKNVLAGAINASAAVMFVFCSSIPWLQTGLAALGSMLGGVLGSLLVRRINERVLRSMVVLIGILLTIKLFIG
jgi:hypothetical protein